MSTARTNALKLTDLVLAHNKRNADRWLFGTLSELGELVGLSSAKLTHRIDDWPRYFANFRDNHPIPQEAEWVADDGRVITIPSPSALRQWRNRAPKKSQRWKRLVTVETARDFAREHGVRQDARGRLADLVRGSVAAEAQEARQVSDNGMVRIPRELFDWLVESAQVDLPWLPDMIARLNR